MEKKYIERELLRQLVGLAAYDTALWATLLEDCGLPNLFATVQVLQWTKQGYVEHGDSVELCWLTEDGVAHVRRVADACTFMEREMAANGC